MKNSSEKKKSQTRSSLMKNLNRSGTYGSQMISLRQTFQRFSLDAWPRGQCSGGENRPCWNWDQLYLYWQNVNDRNQPYRIYTSLNPDSSTQALHDSMLNDDFGRWALICKRCP